MKMSFRTLPIKTKLAIKFGFFVALILFLVWGAIFFIFRDRVIASVQDLMVLQYENITNTISVIEQEAPEDRLQDATSQSIEEATNLGLLTFIFDRDGNSLEAPTYLENYIPRWQKSFFTNTISGQDYLFYAGTYSGLYVVIGKNLSSVYSGIDSLVNALVLVWIFSILLSFGVWYIFSRQALSPLSRLVDEISMIHPDSDSGMRLSWKYASDEIGTLAESFRLLLDRIRTSIDREKEFTQDVSHELRTPLMSLSTSLELLESKTKDANALQKISNMKTTLGNMNALLDELLFLARKTRSHGGEDIGMFEFIQGYFIEQLEPLATQKNIRIMYDCAKDFTLHTERIFLQKVLWNILKNAINYTPSGGSISVQVSKNSVSIEDTGVGMRTEDLAHIWDRFYRIDTSRTKNVAEGYGLGLAIVKKVVDEQGWKVSVSSEPGKGTRFIINF